ncbi:hypothetical protein L1049_023741 [Liquidambar formosana]|uniref:Uncharacterized protein n=1 Tax=Liquidambar formosana TaxID=63359 RepID=A0AAP0RYQ3_LIQFO
MQVLHQTLEIVSCLENLPENAEATIDIPSDKDPHLKKAFDGLQEPITQFLEISDVDWVIYDMAYWLGPIAAKLGVSSAFFSIFCPWTILYVGVPSSAVVDRDDVDEQRTAPEHFTVPPIGYPFRPKWCSTSTRQT